MMAYLRTTMLLLVLVVLGSSTALAHPGHAGHSNPQGGLVAGLMHPLLGFDHLLAMVTVGLLSAQLSGRAIWAIPASFLTCMVIGGVAGMSGMKVPAVEYGVAASIVLLGLAVALNLKLAIVVPVLFVGAFGFIHGQAHGMEMPRIDSPVLYAAGFLATTLVLHVAGVLVGQSALHQKWGERGLRLSGGLIAAAGICFAFMI